MRFTGLHRFTCTADDERVTRLSHVFLFFFPTLRNVFWFLSATSPFIASDYRYSTMASFYVTGQSVNVSANQMIPQTIAEFAIDKCQWIVTRGMEKKKKEKETRVILRIGYILSFAYSYSKPTTS